MQDRQLISSGSPFEAKVGDSRAVRVGDRVIVAGTAPQWPDGHVDPDPEVQARRCFEIIGAALAEAGSGFADVVRRAVYLVDRPTSRGRQRARRVFAEVRPADTSLVVGALLDPAWKVEIEVEAIAPPSPHVT